MSVFNQAVIPAKNWKASALPRQFHSGRAGDDEAECGFVGVLRTQTGYPGNYLPAGNFLARTRRDAPLETAVENTGLT